MRIFRSVFPNTRSQLDHFVRYYNGRGSSAPGVPSSATHRSDEVRSFLSSALLNLDASSRTFDEQSARAVKNAHKSQVAKAWAMVFQGKDTGLSRAQSRRVLQEYLSARIALERIKESRKTPAALFDRHAKELTQLERRRELLSDAVMDVDGRSVSHAVVRAHALATRATLERQAQEAESWRNDSAEFVTGPKSRAAALADQRITLMRRILRVNQASALMHHRVPGLSPTRRLASIEESAQTGSSEEDRESLEHGSESGGLIDFAEFLRRDEQRGSDSGSSDL